MFAGVWGDTTMTTTLSERALEHFGYPHQILKCIEELQELTVELADVLTGNELSDSVKLAMIARKARANLEYIRKNIRLSGANFDERQRVAIMYEIADVMITLHQMLVIFDTDNQIYVYKAEKAKRLDAMISGGENSV